MAIQRRWGERALRRFGQATNDAIAVIPTGFADLDAALGIGGIPRGRITELLGTPTSGSVTATAPAPCCAHPTCDTPIAHDGAAEAAQAEAMVVIIQRVCLLTDTVE